MDKLFNKLVLTFIFLFCLVSFKADAGQEMGVWYSSSCDTEEYAPSLTADEWMPIGSTSGRAWYGLKYTPDGSGTLNACKISAKITLITGTLTSSHHYYMQVWTLTGNNLTTSLGVSSNYIAGDTMSAGNYYDWEITLSSALTRGTTYAVTWFLDSDGDPEDTPEFDTSNFPRIGVDNENNGDAIQGGWWWWYGADKTAAASDLEDDLFIKVYRP